jgi:hypothetical protein
MQLQSKGKKMRITSKDAFEFLHSNDFLYKGKTITRRTFRTMVDNGFFESMGVCECGICYMFDMGELKILIADQNRKNN